VLEKLSFSSHPKNFVFGGFTSSDGIKNPEGFLGHQKSFALLIGLPPIPQDCLAEVASAINGANLSFSK
jgi:hypothetical protein